DYGSVAVVTKKAPAESNTKYAQGGIAAVMDAHDSYESHVRDTLIAGAGICDPEIVEIVVRGGPERIRALIRRGAEFTLEDDRVRLGREGGHSANRAVHAADITGRERERAFFSRVREHPTVQLFDHHFTIDLITGHHL